MQNGAGSMRKRDVIAAILPTVQCVLLRSFECVVQSDASSIAGCDHEVLFPVEVHRVYLTLRILHASRPMFFSVAHTSASF